MPNAYTTNSPIGPRERFDFAGAASGQRNQANQRSDTRWHLAGGRERAECFAEPGEFIVG